MKTAAAMWDWINCHLAGRHEYVVWTNSNRMFLRCLRCGRRSAGWQVADAQAAGARGSQPADGKPRRRLRVLGQALHLLGL